MNLTAEKAAPDRVAGLGPLQIQELGARRQDPAWLRQARLLAWELYEKLPWPDRKDEEWRRVDLSGLPLDRARAAVASLGTDRPRGAVRSGLEADVSGSLFEQDGQSLEQSLDSKWVERGVILCDLDTAAGEHEARVRPYLQRAATNFKFGALADALWSGGAFLWIPDGVEVELPLYLMHRQADAGRAGFPRTILALGRGARAAVVEEFSSETGQTAALTSARVEVFVGEGSQLGYLQIHQGSPGEWSFMLQRSTLGRDSRLVAVAALFGSKLFKERLEANLEGPGASAEMYGLLFGRGAEQFDLHGLVEHRAPHSTSRMIYRSALDGRSSSVFTGNIHIPKPSQKSDAYQSIRNLLLSKEAKADAIPRLEIEANDVRCSHGTTVGPLDEEQIFYLTSRALPEVLARRLLVEGFFQEILSKNPAPGFDEILRERLALKMGPAA